jgi:hypothetical protein
MLFFFLKGNLLCLDIKVPGKIKSLVIQASSYQKGFFMIHDPKMPEENYTENASA